MYLYIRGIGFDSERSCICMLEVSVLPLFRSYICMLEVSVMYMYVKGIGHVFVC
jgi:hypothetical protein